MSKTSSDISEIAAEYSRTTLAGDEVSVSSEDLGGVAVVPDHMKGYNVSREVAVLPCRACDERVTM